MPTESLSEKNQLKNEIVLKIKTSQQIVLNLKSIITCYIAILITTPLNIAPEVQSYPNPQG